MDNIQPTFRALADPTRREILWLLSDEDMTIGELTENFQMTRAAVKKHLTVLDEGGLISIRAQGRKRVASIEPGGFAAAKGWLQEFDKFWDQKLTKLKNAIEKDDIHD